LSRFHRIVAICSFVFIAHHCLLGQARRGATSFFTVQQMHTDLQTSAQISSLIGPKAPAFHLVAQIEIFQGDGKTVSSEAQLEELWEDSLHWKLTVNYPGTAFTEVDNGAQAFTLGSLPTRLCCGPNVAQDITFQTLLERFEDALYSPVSPNLLSSDRLTTATGLCHIRSRSTHRWDVALKPCRCVNAEPALVGVPNSVPLAYTTYCFDPIDLSLHHIEHPNGEGYHVELYDDADFEGRQIARTIEIGNRARMKIITLDSATNFSSLNEAPASDAKRVAPHPQDALLAGDIMHGQLLSGNSVEAGGKLHPPDGTILAIGIILHVDIAGEVTGFQVKDDFYKSMTAETAVALKRWRFRISYQRDHPVAADILITLWSGTP
jgi:hypothetical protein